MSRDPDRDQVVELAVLARRGCPRDAGHGSGPFPGGACYTCHKAAALSGRPLRDELGVYAGFPPPRSPEDGWVPLGKLSTPELVPLERASRFEATETFRALLEAIRGIG